MCGTLAPGSGNPYGARTLALRVRARATIDSLPQGLDTVQDVFGEQGGRGWVVRQGWVVHQGKHLAVEGDGFLAQGLRVPNVAVHNLGEGEMRRARLQLLLVVHRTQHDGASHRILRLTRSSTKRWVRGGRGEEVGREGRHGAAAAHATGASKTATNNRGHRTHIHVHTCSDGAAESKIHTGG